jgi:DNA repair exonuclease SbcCD ATPase subunit
MATLEAAGEGLTFEKVWAAIQATNEQMKVTDERMKATDAQIKAISEQIKVTDAQIKATDAQIKATNAQMRETDKRFGKLNNRFGETVEYMVVPNLVTKFHELGFEFEKAHRDTEIRDQTGRILAEIDVFLENGDRVVIVETKVKPGIGDINDHIERMEKLRGYADAHNDARKYLGAIAGVVFGDSEKTYALKKGFYVIEPSGDTFTIIEPKGEYHPHEW